MLDQDIVIRNIDMEDAPELQRIYSAITKTDSSIEFEKILSERLQDKKDSASFVAEFNGKVVGYMISYVVYGGFGLEKSAWIATLGVDPRNMGQGIGQKLAAETFKFYKEIGIKHIFSSVIWDSVDLISFFRSLGFERSNFINIKKELS
ncbi:MAG: GNAT family N-acetyltransferase [Desulfohalobiaceae bacterium]|nr:GNAT family N-acetyltransferase [Desulfohalobiaceae bacterium]